MQDDAMTSFKWQMQRARFYLWVQATLIGIQTFARIAAAGVGLLLLAWIAGWISPAPLSVAAVFAAAAVGFVLQSVRHGPGLSDAADLIDRWSGKADLARSCIGLPSDHPARALIAQQAERAAANLSSRLAWPGVPVQSLALPCVIVALGVVILPGNDVASARVTGSAAQSDANLSMMPGAPADADQPILATDAAEPIQTAQVDEGGAEPLNLADILAQDSQHQALELGIDMQATAGVGPAAAPTPDADGAGTVQAAAQTGHTTVSPEAPGNATLALAASASDAGRSLSADTKLPATTDLDGQTVRLAMPPARPVTRMERPSSPEDRALSRRYLANLAGSE